MLAGNLASIGVGGIVTVMTSLIVRFYALLNVSVSVTISITQWPEDFDFAATRRINVMATQAQIVGTRLSEDDSEDEKKRDSAEVYSTPVSSETAAAEEARELDPVALMKSFKLAAWSSVVLVSTICA